jgi:hypothetical protein
LAKTAAFQKPLRRHKQRQQSKLGRLLDLAVSMEKIGMNNFFNKKTCFIILACGAVWLPHSVFASTAYIQTNHSEFFVGDTILFSVRINSENKDINAVEGNVLLGSSAEMASLTDINTSGSEFSLWPGKPFPSENNASISFTGGSPGGLLAEDAIVFNFVLKLKEAGQLTLSPSNIGVYLHDGKGTKDEVAVKDLVVNVLPKNLDVPSTDDWSAVLSNDKTAPESFEITPGKDPSIFDNRYFISFFATDAESGVAYYEVQEGESGLVRTESPYVLRDQSLKNLIRVTAVDKAGNERTEEWMPPAPTVPFYKNIPFWIIVFFIALSYASWRFFRRENKIPDEPRS